mgnify:CR=1 FL=1
MKNYTKRQWQDVQSELTHKEAWSVFGEWLAEQAREQRQYAKGLSDDVTKLLLREQATGAADTLEELFQRFKIHVSHMIETTKSEE